MKNTLFATLAAVLLTATSTFAAPLPGPGRDIDGPRFAQGPGDRDFNYGYAKNHRVTNQERARWEAQHRNDRRADNRPNNDRRTDDRFDRNQNYGFDRDHKVTRDERRHWEEGHNYGYDQNHRVTPQERARWEASYRR
ncbi:hypothetical protein [Hymenobacter bucti]|uniref:Uncharacterized protein n=1 Tax=Hymenobacter bucti TaxID=1844114 RepID=A0ABW4QU56_9BACT